MSSIAFKRIDIDGEIVEVFAHDPGISIDFFNKMNNLNRYILDDGTRVDVVPLPDKFNKTNNMDNKITFGEKLVGIEFNPSNDDKVAKVKELYAEIANILHDDRKSADKNNTSLSEQVYNHAIGELFNSQMSTVKYITFKY